MTGPRSRRPGDMENVVDLELVSFKICPFVQRSVVTLRHKAIPYRITYIDLADPPEWFHAISPFGKVPLLRVDGDAVIFESAVINEYLDEITPPPLHPADPLQRALNRGWIEFGSECLVNQYQLLTASDDARFDQRRAALAEKLERLETVVSDGPYFNGPDLSLVDTAYAPLFMRLEILHRRGVLDTPLAGPRVGRWCDALLALPAVRESVVPEFEALFVEHLHGLDGVAAHRLAAS